MKPFIGLRLSLAGFAALGAACNDQPTAPAPAALELVQAPSGAGAPGFPLADTLKVRLMDPTGRPRAGVAVSWDVREGGGSVAPINDSTDAEGFAAAIWTLGARPGPNEVRASTLGESSVTFAAAGEAFKVDQLAANELLGCGLVTGVLWCWGDEFWGSSAPASARAEFGWKDASPGIVDDTHEFVGLAVGANSVCGLDAQLAVWCASALAPTVARVSGLPPLQSLVGASFAPNFCGLAASDSTAWCWTIGGLPAQVPGSITFTKLSMDVGYQFSIVCGLRVDSTAACWGTAPLGDGSTAPSAVPVPVNGGLRFVELGAGFGFACGRTGPGAVWCWGSDYVMYGGYLGAVLQPALATTGVAMLGVGNTDVLAIDLSHHLTRWAGSRYETDSLTGLSGLPVERFGNNGVSCLLLAGGQVYCTGELWDNSSSLLYYDYFPVPPVRTAPVTTSHR